MPIGRPAAFDRHGAAACQLDPDAAGAPTPVDDNGVAYLSHSLEQAADPQVTTASGA
jgi:hypothetical protein